MTDRHLWMDISEDDDDVINSIVYGCTKHGMRGVANDVTEVRYKLKSHHKTLHPKTDSAAVEHVGDVPRPLNYGNRYTVGNGQSQAEIMIQLIKDNEGITSVELAEKLGKKRDTVSAMLTKLKNKGLVTADDSRIKQWSAA